VTAGFPDSSTPWREARFTVVDLETTGLDPELNEIISFATVTVANGRVELGDSVYRLVRPRVMPDWDTIRIHGLREADLDEAPPLAEVLPVLEEAIAGRVIVAHVAAVEHSFLTAAFATADKEFTNPMVDTAALDRELRGLRRQPPAQSDPIGLSDLARSLGLPVHRPHEADGDALTTAQAFIALASHLDGFERQTVGSLERAGSEERDEGTLARIWRAMNRPPRPSG
jgi:DNA polymerase III subunit epsilon